VCVLYHTHTHTGVSTTQPETKSSKDTRVQCSVCRSVWIASGLRQQDLRTALYACGIYIIICVVDTHNAKGAACCQVVKEVTTPRSLNDRRAPVDSPLWASAKLQHNRAVTTMSTVDTLDEDPLDKWKKGARTQNQVTPRCSTAPVHTRDLHGVHTRHMA
jgi:hypothetical protein